MVCGISGSWRGTATAAAGVPPWAAVRRHVAQAGEVREQEAHAVGEAVVWVAPVGRKKGASSASASRPRPRRPLPAGPAPAFRLRRRVEIALRNVALLRDLVRFYGLTRQQIHARHFGAERTAANRLGGPWQT